MSTSSPPTTPTVDELAADPAGAGGLPPEVAADLLARLAALQTVLLGRLLAAGATTIARQPAADDRPLTVPEVAARLQVGKGYVYDLIRRGEIAAIRFGKYVRVASAALREWETRHQEKALDRGKYVTYSSLHQRRGHEGRRGSADSQPAQANASRARGEDRRGLE